MFYGWWIIALAFLGAVYYGSTSFYGFTAFFNPLIEEFGWSYAAISLAASIRGLEAGFMEFAVGILLDKFGSRKVVFAGCMLTGLGFFLLSNINSLPMFYLMFVLVCIGGGALSPVFVTYNMSRWFHKRLGLALGLSMAGFGAGGFVVPAIVHLLDSVGWRNTFVVFGVAAFILGIIMSAFLRNSPRDISSTPDGLPVDDPQLASADSPGNVMSDTTQRDYTLREALSYRSFWILIYASLATVFSVNMVITHLMPYLEDLGYLRSLAGIVAMMIPVTSIVGRIGVGWASDFISSKTILVTAIICQVIGVILFLNAQLSFVLVPFIIFFGIAFGSIMVIRVKILSNYYGKGHIGSIAGFVLSISMLGSFSPLFAGFIFDTAGSYNIAWIVNIVVLIIGIPLIFAMKNPREQGASYNPAFS